jgi:hypothetical protein
MRMYLKGLKDVTGNGMFEDEVTLEGRDYRGQRLVGFFHRNYVFDGALEVEVSEAELFHMLLYSDNSRLSITVIPCGGGFIGRRREIQVDMESLYYKGDNQAWRGLSKLKLTPDNSRRE